MTAPTDTATRARYADLIEQLQSYSDRSCHAAATLIADLLAELDRLADENRALREQLEEAQLRSIEARNPGIDMDEVRASRAAAADRGVTNGDRNEGDER